MIAFNSRQFYIINPIAVIRRKRLLFVFSHTRGHIFPLPTNHVGNLSRVKPTAHIRAHTLTWAPLSRTMQQSRGDLRVLLRRIFWPENFATRLTYSASCLPMVFSSLVLSLKWFVMKNNRIQLNHKVIYKLMTKCDITCIISWYGLLNCFQL